MRHDADEREDLWEAIDEDEKGLDGDNGIYHARQKSLCYDCMLFDKLRKIVQSRSCELLGDIRGAHDGITYQWPK